MSRITDHKLSGFNQRIGIAEHLGLSNVCNQVNTDPSKKLACDVEAQAYCARPTKIASSECSPYVSRVVRTKEAENILYKDAVQPSGSTFVQYYNAMGDAGAKYLKQNINNLSDPNLVRFMKLIKEEKNGAPSELFNRLANQAASNCMNCDADWLITHMKRVTSHVVSSMANEPASRIIDYLVAQSDIYYKFYDLFEPVRVLLSGKITIADINNPKLLKLMNKPGVITKGVDSVVISYIAGNKFTKVKATVSDLIDKPKLYDPVITSFMNSISKLYPDYPLYKLYCEAKKKPDAKFGTSKHGETFLSKEDKSWEWIWFQMILMFILFVCISTLIYRKKNQSGINATPHQLIKLFEF